jgi:hypothetical protein
MFLVQISNIDHPFDTVENMVTASRSWAKGRYRVWLKDTHCNRGVNAGLDGKDRPVSDSPTSPSVTFGNQRSVAAGLRRYELNAGHLDVGPEATTWHSRQSMDGYLPTPFFVYSAPPRCFGAYEPKNQEPGMYVLSGHGSTGTPNFIIQRALKDGFEPSHDHPTAVGHCWIYKGKKGSQLTVYITDDGRLGGPEWEIICRVPQ